MHHISRMFSKGSDALGVMKRLYYEKHLVRRGGDDPAHDKALRNIRALFAESPKEESPPTRGSNEEPSK